MRRALALLVMCSTVLCAQTPEELGVRTAPWAEAKKFERPLFIGHAGDGSGLLYVVEQIGLIWTVDPTGARKAFADIRDRVSRKHNEEGLLGLAFHPKFAENRRVFLHYNSSLTPKRTSVVSEFTVKDGVLVPDSERKVLTLAQPFGNHKGGMIAFGPDGKLYIGFGDGGSANDPFKVGQDLGSLLAKILRIDVDVRPGGAAYGVPPDNPFVAHAGAKPEIWAYGLRNPWRFSFDKKTGELWAGDVGQESWEEVDVIEKGGNYGWNAFEGSHPFTAAGLVGGPLKGPSPHTPPIAEYPIPAKGRSITGGYVYRGAAIPKLDGMYLFGDFVSGRIWGCAKQADGKYRTSELFHTKLSIASFGEDAAGELYFATFEGLLHKVLPR